MYRFSSPSSGPYRIGKHHRCVFRVGRSCLVGCYGLDSDARELAHHLQKQLASHEMKDIEPINVSRLISNYLYEHRLYCTPIVVGLDSSNQPYICSMDGLGAQTECNTYAVIGTANELVLGLCESCYRENLSSGQLMTNTEKILKLALERDILSGGQVNVLTLTTDGIYSKDFETHDV